MNERERKREMKRKRNEGTQTEEGDAKTARETVRDGKKLGKRRTGEIKNIFLKRNLKPYLGCLTSGEPDLEREGKKKRKKEKRRVI